MGRRGGAGVAQLVMVEGLPGSGKTTTAARLHHRLAGRGVEVHHFAEGRTDHPVDLEQAAVLSPGELDRLRCDFPDEAGSLAQAASRCGDSWLVLDRERAGWSAALRDRLREHDGYDGAVTPDRHAQVLLERWQRFGRRHAAGSDPGVYLFECVLLQNPVCALMARFDRTPAQVEAHVRALAEAVTAMDPVLVHLDAGDPAVVLAAAAAERPAEWLDLVVSYHTGQGYGLARGLQGFDGLVAFMRERRELELDLLDRLPLTTLRLDVSDGDWDRHHAAVAVFVEAHLDTGARSVAPFTV